jgi:hypothetical protein
MSYRLTANPNAVMRLSDGFLIPRGHRWWDEYEAWCAAGNTPEPVPQPTLAEVKLDLCAQVDASADAAYIAIGGPSPGRLAEYKQAKADADAFKAAGYAGTVPDTIACWSQAKAWTDQQACDDILATAASWEMALAVIRRQRLIGKANVNAAADATTANTAADAAMAIIQSIPAGAG